LAAGAQAQPELLREVIEEAQKPKHALGVLDLAALHQVVSHRIDSLELVFGEAFDLLERGALREEAVNDLLQLFVVEVIDVQLRQVEIFGGAAFLTDFGGAHTSSSVCWVSGDGPPHLFFYQYTRRSAPRGARIAWQLATLVQVVNHRALGVLQLLHRV